MNEQVSYYEVCFKCTLKTFVSELTEINIEVGDYVTVQCEKGYDMGIISRKLISGVDIDPYTFVNSYKILSKVEDDKKTIEDLLYSKIIAENEALTLCRNYCHGRKVGSLLEVVTTEFQYDHKKLTIFVKKIAEVSVCKLVRKLFDSFHTRICVEEIYSVDPIISTAETYLSLTGIPLTLNDVYFDSTRMPPQEGKNNKAKKNGPRTQNGYTQSGANSSLLSALHHYRPNITSPTEIYQPNTVSSIVNSSNPNTTNPSTAYSSYGIAPTLRNAPISISNPYQGNHGRNEQRFNERIYNPQSMLKNQYQQYNMPIPPSSSSSTLHHHHPHHSNQSHNYSYYNPSTSNMNSHHIQRSSRGGEYVGNPSISSTKSLKTPDIMPYYTNEVDYSPYNHHHHHHQQQQQQQQQHSHIDDHYYHSTDIQSDYTQYNPHLNPVTPTSPTPSVSSNDYQYYEESNPPRITLSINEGETIIELPGHSGEMLRKTSLSFPYDDSQSYSHKHGYHP